MLIVSYSSPSGGHYFALVRELHRTAKRIYVEHVAGSARVLNGSDGARYVPTSAVLIENATQEQFAALERANAAYRAEHQAIKDRASAAHLANRAIFDRAVRAIVEQS